MFRNTTPFPTSSVNQSNKRKKKRENPSSSSSSTISTAFKGIGLGLSVASLLLIFQALYVAIATPRLPPPDNSGHDFVEEGLTASYEEEEGDDEIDNENYSTEEEDDDDDVIVVQSLNERDDGKNEHLNSSIRSSSLLCSGILYNENHDNFEEEEEEEEFRLVLLGDSPVEGIGNDCHEKALGGQTAMQFSKLLKNPVRYWSLGKSGLTAQGIENEMLPYLWKKNIVRKNNHYKKIDAVIVSCGVNNTLLWHTPEVFGEEVRSLLSSIRNICGPETKIIVMELLDFALMPFIPYPLNKVASWRSRGLQDEMEGIVKISTKDNNMEMAYMPRISEVLGKEEDRYKSPLLTNHLSREEIKALTLADFFADDNFHPAGIGNTIMGQILAETYINMK